MGSVSTVAFRRNQASPPLSQADQNGSVRLQAVDNMANRAFGRRARIGRKAEISSGERRAASSATIHASTVSPRTELITSRQRQNARTIGKLKPISIVSGEFNAGL